MRFTIQVSPYGIRVVIACAIALALFGTSSQADRALAATFTVNSTGDGGDFLLADGVCADAGGACTLRAAIQQANFTAGGDTINFGIGSGAQTIMPGSALPTIVQPVTLNATTQPGFAGAPIIELSGFTAGGSANGLTISAGGSTVRGLVINSWSGYGIELNALGGNTVAGNYIGTDIAGSAALGNTLSGVWVNGTSGNTIGGASAGDRNVISGNTGAGVAGVRIENPTASGNTVVGNFIGVDASGAAAIANYSGVQILEAPSNTVGGLSAAARNVISGNAMSGVAIEGPASTGNSVIGNYIGIDAGGNSDVGNGTGVRISASNGNTIGGATAGARNVISGSAGRGVHLIGTLDGGHTIQGNYIGTNAAGTAAISNHWGIYTQIDGEASQIIGNLISGNTQFAILGSAPVQVRGNLIGTQADGISPLGNGSDALDLVSGAVVGGIAPGEANVIAFNAGRGVRGGAMEPIRGNSIHSNGGLGIDIGIPGPTLNDANDVDGVQNFPVVNAASESMGMTTIGAQLHSTADTTLDVDFYASAICDATGYGEGETYIGSTTATTDSNGNVSISETYPIVLAGRTVTATATNPDGMTSEFSQCFGGTGVDTDGDGCTDAEESGVNPNFGGDRDFMSPWDFFDVPTPALTSGNPNGARNKAVALTDVGAALFYVGTTNDGGSNVNGVDYDTDYNANTVDDGREYDRTPSSISGKPWRSGPPNNAVSLQDVGVLLSQVGDNCANPP